MSKQNTPPQMKPAKGKAEKQAANLQAKRPEVIQGYFLFPNEYGALRQLMEEVPGKQALPFNEILLSIQKRGTVNLSVPEQKGGNA